MRQVTVLSRWIARVLDVVWLAALSAYVVTGVSDIPFHGDESSLVFMSRDYATLVQQHDFSAVYYELSPSDPAAQELRILNGTVGKMAMGLAWDLAGLSVDDLNGPWAWDVDYDVNAALGHIPGERLLRVARLSSALLTALGVIAAFGIARFATGSRIAAWIASLVLATDPAVLLNGRRAMMEGSLLGFGTLVVLVAVWLAREQARAATPARLWAGYAAFGVASGLAIASKHTAVIAVGALFVALLLEPRLRATVETRPERNARRWRLALAGVLAWIVFLLLNPAWWSDISGMPDRVLHARNVLMDVQVKFYGGYGGAREHAAGFVKWTFFDGPQYYEDPDWAGYPAVMAQIAAYDGTWLAGRHSTRAWGVLLGAGTMAGVIVCAVRVVRRRLDRGRADQAAERTPDDRAASAWVVLVWAGLTAGAILLTNPLDWQRYYLPVKPAVAVLTGIGAAGALGAARWTARYWSERNRA
jgi:4-amino-4-deoxy-L-arabinose transferase-like glycosyltransferase